MKRLAFLFGGVFLVACGGGERADSDTTSGALGDQSGASAKVELIQAGFFEDADQTSLPREVPRLVHIGFGDSRSGPWDGVTDVSIKYSGGHNEAVVIDVPAAYASKKLLMYSIEYDIYSAQAHASYQKGWISDRVVKLDAPKGKWVAAAVYGGAGYPFSPECYGVNIQNERFDGKLRGIIYGFTKSTKSDYDANNDVPWLDAEGNPKNEGFAPISFQHDGGYKGSYVSSRVAVRVPDGESLVFKASLDRFTGSCMSDNDTKQIPPPPGQDSHLTKTYFQEVH